MPLREALSVRPLIEHLDPELWGPNPPLHPQPPCP